MTTTILLSGGGALGAFHDVRAAIEVARVLANRS
jgi:hypothetical protein